MGDGETVGILRRVLKNEVDKKVVITRMMRGMEIKRDQEIQMDWARIETSGYCSHYKECKSKVGRERYLSKEGGNIGGLRKEWARLRCGNISKEGRKGFKDMRCRVCKECEEDLEHIWECQGIRGKMKKEIVQGIENWRRRAWVGSWRASLIEAMKGMPIKEVCDYIREFEKIIKAGKEQEEGEVEME